MPASGAARSTLVVTSNSRALGVDAASSAAKPRPGKNVPIAAAAVAAAPALKKVRRCIVILPEPVRPPNGAGPRRGPECIDFQAQLPLPRGERAGVRGFGDRE